MRQKNLKFNDEEVRPDEWHMFDPHGFERLERIAEEIQDKRQRTTILKVVKMGRITLRREGPREWLFHLCSHQWYMRHVGQFYPNSREALISDYFIAYAIQEQIKQTELRLNKNIKKVRLDEQ